MVRLWEIDKLDKVRRDTPWVITLSYCAVLKCVGASRCWLGGCYCGCCCCCCCCVFVFTIVLITGSKAVSFFFSFFFFPFSFSFNPFNPAIIIDISVNRDKSLIAMLSFSFSPHPRTVFEIIDNEYGMEMASFQWQRVRRSIPSREPKFRFNFIFDNRRWQTLRNPNWLICHAYSYLNYSRLRWLRRLLRLHLYVITQ